MTLHHSTTDKQKVKGFPGFPEKEASSSMGTESSTDSMDTTDSTATDSHVTGEGGTTGDFVIERSIVFATLEVCVRCFWTLYVMCLVTAYFSDCVCMCC